MTELKESKEMFDGIVGLVILFVETFKDGAQPEDAEKILIGLLSRQEFKDAIADIYKVGAEFKSMDSTKGIDLAMHLITKVPKIIEAFKK